MLDNLLTDSIDIAPAENNPPFSDNGLYDKEFKKKEELLETWKKKSSEEMKEYNGSIKKYFKEKGLNDLSKPGLIPSRNFNLLNKEIQSRINSDSSSRLLSISNLHFEQSILELLENMENVEHIRELYKIHKRAVGDSKNAGIGTEEALRLKNCMRQGRELYLAGKTGSLMVKPLNYFYSLTAYAYALIILNNPIRYSLDTLPGSHGLNYIPDGMRSQIGGDMPQGTFSDLFSSFPTLNTRNIDFEIHQDASQSILAFFKTRFTVSVGTLLSMIPEIREYYGIVTGNNGRTHPLTVSMSKNPRSIIWEFQIGDGDAKPNISDVENSFGGFEVSERYGKYFVEVPSSETYKIKATIYCDAKGKLWYIENPFFPIILPELCVHFILTSTLSNLMRYSPDHWGSVLLNEVNSESSLITRKYLSSFENKFPFLLLRSLSKYFPYVAES